VSYPQSLYTGIYNKMLSNRYKTVINQSACCERKGLDLVVYAGCIQAGKESRSQKESDYLSSFKEKKIKIKKLVLLFSFIALTAPLGSSYAYATTTADSLRLYAHSRIISNEQYKCFDKLITRESNWRVNAKNGSHYGIGQMKNKSYKNLDGFSQVDWSIRYIKKRYGSMCNAWRFFVDKGYH